MDVLMPQLGETVAEGKITQWFKAAGDPIKPGDNLFEIETDKVSMEVPSTTAGVLAEIRVPAGAGGAGRARGALVARGAGAGPSEASPFPSPPPIPNPPPSERGGASAAPPRRLGPLLSGC